MKKKKKNDDRNIEEQEIEEQEQRVNFPIYNNFLIHFIVFVLPIYPLIILFLIYFLLIINYFENIFVLFWLYFFLPLVIIGAYLLYIVGVVELTSLFGNYYNKKSPPEEGLFSRTFNDKDVEDERIKYYHYRGFIIKFPLWLAYKSPFRWISYWVLKKIGHNKLDKSMVYLEAFQTLEFSEIGKDVIVYPGSAASSHVVDSIFGNLTIEKVVLNDRSIIYPGSVMAPGCTLDEKSVFMPNVMCPKGWRTTKENKFFSGSPIKSIDNEYSGIFSLLPIEANEFYKKNDFFLFN